MATQSGPSKTFAGHAIEDAGELQVRNQMVLVSWNVNQDVKVDVEQTPMAQSLGVSSTRVVPGVVEHHAVGYIYKMCREMRYERGQEVGMRNKLYIVTSDVVYRQNTTRIDDFNIIVESLDFPYKWAPVFERREVEPDSAVVAIWCWDFLDNRAPVRDMLGDESEAYVSGVRYIGLDDEPRPRNAYVAMARWCKPHYMEANDKIPPIIAGAPVIKNGKICAFVVQTAKDADDKIVIYELNEDTIKRQLKHVKDQE